MIYVNYPFLTGMPAVLWETRWGWSKAFPLTFPPAGAAECWTLLPKVTRSYSEVREISAAQLEKGIHSYGARWLGNASTRVRVPVPMQIFATCLQKKGRVDACRVGNSWQVISDIILPNLLLPLALFYKWKRPSGWEMTSLATRPLGSCTSPVLQVISFSSQMAASCTEFPNQCTWIRNQTLASQLPPGVSKVPQ